MTMSENETDNKSTKHGKVAEPLWEEEPKVPVVIDTTTTPTQNEDPEKASTTTPTDMSDKPTEDAPVETPPSGTQSGTPAAGAAVVALVLVGVGVAVGVVKATMRSRPSDTSSSSYHPGPTYSHPSSGPPPAAPPSYPASAPAPTTTTSSSPSSCENESSAFATCVINAGQSSDSCVSCINGYTPDTYSTCSDLEYSTCMSIAKCPVCGPCEAEYSAVMTCYYQDTCGTILC